MKLLPIALGLLSLASVNALAADALSLQGKTIGVAVVGTQHFWDREAYKGATEEVEKLGGKAIGVDGGRDNQVPDYSISMPRREPSCHKATRIFHSKCLICKSTRC